MDNKENSVSAKARLNYFDNLKFLLIVLVVIGHMLNGGISDPTGSRKMFFVFAYAFHMPLFLFVSGLFQSKKNDKFPIAKIITYIVLGYLMKSLIAVAIGLAEQKAVSFSLFDGDGAFWYLFSMAAFTLICWLVRNINPCIVFLFSIVLALMVGYDSSIGDEYCLSRTVVFFPFFYSGFLASPQKIADFFSKIWVKIISWIIVIGWAAVSVLKVDYLFEFHGVITGRNSYSKFGIYADNGVYYRLIFLALAALLCAAVTGICTNRKIPFVTESGKHTLGVYFWHRAVIAIIVGFGTKEYLRDTFPSVWIYMLVAISVVLAAVLSLPVFSKPLDCIASNIKKAFTKQTKE